MIANTLVVYSYHIKNNGLLNGKMGAILFLYRYAAVSGETYYREYAAKLLNGMMKITHSLSSDFENGVAGIGWAVSYMLNNGYVEGELDGVIRGIDERVLGHIDYDGKRIFGPAVYMAERLRCSATEYDLSRHAVRMTDYIMQELSRTNVCPTLYHVNSVLYFVSTVRKQPEAAMKVGQVIATLNKLYGRMQHETRMTKTDVRIHTLLLRNLGVDCNVLLHANTHGDRTEDMPERDGSRMTDFLQTAWQELLYLGNLHSKMPLQPVISAFVDSKQEQLQESGFSLQGGLIGLGMALMASNSGDKKNN